MNSLEGSGDEVGGDFAKEDGHRLEMKRAFLWRPLRVLVDGDGVVEEADVGVQIPAEVDGRVICDEKSLG